MCAYARVCACVFGRKTVSPARGLHEEDELVVMRSGDGLLLSGTW